MSPEELSVAALRQPGQYLWHVSGQYGPIAVFRLRHPGCVPPGGVEVPGVVGECYLAYSPHCTHLGCSVVPKLAAGTAGEFPDGNGVIVCPCHSSNFDLVRHGLVVLGPATDFLPQMGLAPAAASGHLKLVDWVRDRSVPYGVPFGQTAG